jgi:hypothetical protein
MTLPILLAACAFQPSATPQTYADEFASILPATIGQASRFERDILEDGLVTAEENERAQGAYIDCLEEGGVRVVSAEVDDKGVLESLAYGSGDHADRANQDRVERECRAEFYSLVEAGWVAAVSATDSDEAYLARISSCLRARGHDVPPSPGTGEDLLRDASQNVMNDFRPCAESTRYPTEP